MAEPIQGTPTRRQLLELRGYPADVVNGNGHSPAPPELESGPAVARDLPTESNGSVDPRACSECGGPIQGRRPEAVVCSAACKTTRHHRLERERKAARSMASPEPQSSQAVAQSETVPGPEIRISDTHLGLVAVVAALAGAGLTVSLDVAGVTVTARG